MELKKLYEKYAYQFFGALFICAAASLYAGEYYKLGINGFFIFFAVMFFTACFVVFDIFKRKAALYITVIIALILTAVILQLASVSVINAFVDSFRWLLYSRNTEAENALISALISVLIIMLICTGVIFNVLRFRIARLASGAGLFIFTVISAVMERSAGIAVIFFVFAYMLCVFYELFLPNKNALTYLLPLIILSGIIISVLPSKQEPIQWTAVKSVISHLRNVANSIGEEFTLFFSPDSSEFRVNMLGFSNDGNIGGELTQTEDRYALEITNNAISGGSLYLTGAVLDSYTGRDWVKKQNSDNFEYPDYALDSLELALAFYNSGIFFEEQEIKNSIFKTRDINITYMKSRTKNLFYSLKTTRIDNDISANYKGSAMYFRSPAKVGTAYRTGFIDINYQHPFMLDLLRNPPADNTSDTKKLRNTALQNFRHFPIGEIPENYKEILNNRREHIYNNYTALPDSVPERVYEKAREITSGADNQYDKMKAIEAYFGNFTYTLCPPVLPDNAEDFTDWFIFEGYEGYCTYFATSVAVLGRAAGIPTRYVQGYAFEAETTEFGKSYIVDENRAHAWVEAYIDGIGWVPFEASPGYSATLYSEWPEAVIEPTTPQPEPQKPAPEPVRPKPPAADLPEPEETAADNNILLTVIIITGIIFAFIVSVIIAAVLVSAYNSKRRYRKYDLKRRYIADFTTILLLLELGGNKPDAGETARAFAERLASDKFTEITHIYESVKFGNYDITKESSENIREYKDRLMKEMKIGLTGRVRIMLG